MREDNIKIDQAIILAYSQENNVSMEEASRRLHKNYEDEIHNVDIRKLVLRAITICRQISPKVMGLKSRENQVLSKIKDVERKNIRLSQKIFDIEMRLDGLELKRKPFWKIWLQKLTGRIL